MKALGFFLMTFALARNVRANLGESLPAIEHRYGPALVRRDDGPRHSYSRHRIGDYEVSVQYLDGLSVRESITRIDQREVITQTILKVLSDNGGVWKEGKATPEAERTWGRSDAGAVYESKGSPPALVVYRLARSADGSSMPILDLPTNQEMQKPVAKGKYMPPPDSNAPWPVMPINKTDWPFLSCAAESVENAAASRREWRMKNGSSSTDRTTTTELEVSVRNGGKVQGVVRVRWLFFANGDGKELVGAGQRDLVVWPGQDEKIYPFSTQDFHDEHVVRWRKVLPSGNGVGAWIVQFRSAPDRVEKQVGSTPGLEDMGAAGFDWWAGQAHLPKGWSEE